MDYRWYFNDELSPSDELVDKFADSKFGMDKWTSFSREIIQNSLDARDDYSKPVEVVFDLNKQLRLSDIPGGEYTKYVLSKCIDKAKNKQTKQAYDKGMEILNKEFVYCLKVSDFNTCGVKTGRNDSWGAFVFDEGISVKQRPGSAGSHGVGKKVPFIISTCNTVFYATKNKYFVDDVMHSDTLVQGKTTLINWDNDEGMRKSPKGWFGKVNEQDASPKNRILPVMNEEIQGIHPYFVRKDEFGTDVTIIGVNAYESEDKIKQTIISSIIENFFVAIKEGILKVTVFGEKIDSHENTVEKAFGKWYQPTDALHNSMSDLIRIYAQEPDVIPIKKDGEVIGDVNLYFDASSELNRKYYTVVREHGMKICEYRINRSDKAFSAIAVVKGDKINAWLSELENAAHDAFVTSDEDIALSQDALKALRNLQKCVEAYIVERTTIDDGEDQKIEGLYEILAVPGFTPKITKKDSKVHIKRNKVNKRKKKKLVDATPAPVSPATPDPEPVVNPESEPKKRKEKVQKLYNSYSFGPILLKNEEGYLLRVKVKHDMKDCEFRIRSINSDEKIDNSIADMLVSAKDKFKKYKAQDGCISKIKLIKDQLYELQIKTSRDIKYRLTAELWYKEVQV